MKGIVRSSKFRHVFGKAVRKDDHYDNLMPGTAGPDSNLCDVNSKFFGLPWRGGGGPFVVWPLSKTGRLPPDVPLCTGHGGPVMDLAFSPFHDNIIASASDDTTVKIWDIPEGGPTEDMNTPSLNFSGHMKKVILVRWNPVADNILTSVSFDNTVKLWDVSRGVEAASYNDHPESIQAFDWNFCGSKYATYSKDKHVRIVDPRNNVAAACFDAGHQGTKGAKVCFLGDRRIFCTIGFSRQSERQMFFWDERDTSKSLFELTMDIASGTLMPFFDPDSSLLYLAGKGDTNIRYFEIDDVDPYQHFIGIYTGKEPQRGMCMAPKRTADVGNCEVARFMRLTQNGFEPLSFTVPRKGDHFQVCFAPHPPSPFDFTMPRKGDDFQVCFAARESLALNRASTSG